MKNNRMLSCVKMRRLFLAGVLVSCFLSVFAETSKYSCNDIPKLEKAAANGYIKKGDAKAQYELGVCYEIGDGVAKDLGALRFFLWIKSCCNAMIIKKKIVSLQI